MLIKIFWSCFSFFLSYLKTSFLFLIILIIFSQLFSYFFLSFRMIVIFFPLFEVEIDPEIPLKKYY